jgi:hypothetical protein
LADLVKTWSRMLEPWAGRPSEVLEIGSFEGASATRFLEILPLARITCIDPFTGDPFGKPAYYGDIATIESRFDANVARFGSRVRKVKSRSIPALEALAQTDARFDVIYVDGSHLLDDVIVDSILSWRLLKNDGLMIWDDYRGGATWPAAERPKRAIDTFLWLHPDHEILRKGYQLFVRKAPCLEGASKEIRRSLKNLSRSAFR